MTPGSGRPLTDEHCEEGKYAPLMAFDCRGLEPIEFAFMGPQWRVESVSIFAFEPYLYVGVCHVWSLVAFSACVCVLQDS